MREDLGSQDGHVRKTRDQVIIIWTRGTAAVGPFVRGGTTKSGAHAQREREKQ